MGVYVSVRAYTGFIVGTCLFNERDMLRQDTLHTRNLLLHFTNTSYKRIHFFRRLGGPSAPLGPLSP